MNKFIKNNSPTILTVVGSVGVGITAVMSARDTVKAIQRLDYERYNNLKELSKKEKIKLLVPCYIPTFIAGLSTILCICSANKLNKNIQNSLAGAYMLLDNSYKEYKESVRDLYGEEGSLNVVKNISSKQVDRANAPRPDGTDVFFDFFSLQFFNAKMEDVQEAEKAANELLQTAGYVSLETIYSLLGEELHGSDELLGWSIGAGRKYGYDRIQIRLDEVAREDGSKYYVLDFVNGPTNDYMNL